MPPFLALLPHLFSSAHNEPSPARPWIVPVGDQCERDGKEIAALLHPHLSAMVPELTTGQKWEKHRDGVELGEAKGEVYSDMCWETLLHRWWQ